MALEVVVVPPAQFDAWLRARRRRPSRREAQPPRAAWRCSAAKAASPVIRSAASPRAARAAPTSPMSVSRRLIGPAACRRRGRIRPLDRRGAASEARCAHAGVRPADPADARRARGLHGSCDEHAARVGALAQRAAASCRRARGARARLGTARGWRMIKAVNNTHIGVFYIATALLFFVLAGVLALLMRTQLALPGGTLLGARGLQPGLHHARHGDDVPVRRAGRRGGRRLPAARHARRARPAFPAPLGLRLLGLRGRRAGVLLHALLRRLARRRLVHVSAAHERASTRPAPAPTSGCSASALSRSRRSLARSS